MPLPKLLNRESELAALDEAWTKAGLGDSQFVLVWGRRRVGKTFLLSHFARGKRVVFFGATQQAEAIELSRLHEAVRRGLGAAVADLAGGRFPSWEAALRFFVALADRGGEPLVVILDEVPYLTRSTPGFASIVQTVWDHVPPGTRILFVLTGSAVGIVQAMVDARGALRGRPTLTLRVDPMDLLAAHLFLPKLEPSVLLEAYAACGGYPLHLQHWDQDASTETNLTRLAAKPAAILLEDAGAILREELAEAGGYSRILAAIGRGRTRFSAIASEAGQRIDHPLEVLTRIGFVRKAIPVGAPRGAQANYEIADPYLAFWFGVLYSDIPFIEAGEGQQVLRRKRPQWQRHLGEIFEEAARAHARRLVSREELPGDLVIGRWWSTTKEACEVDVLGLRGSRTQLIGEARWSKDPLGSRDLHELTRKSSRVPRPADAVLYALWGRGGVRPEVRGTGALGFDAEAVVTP